MPRLSDSQLEERARGLGASDIATAAGVNPWQTPYELYLTKIGELDPDARLDDAARDRMERGHRLEDVALEWDRDRRGLDFRRVNGTVWHPRLPFLFCHPDARRWPYLPDKQLIEVKTSARTWREVPRHVELQCHAQMAVTGALSVEVLVLGFDGPPVPFLVSRDEEMVAAVEGLAAAFWDRVERRDPPPMDGSSEVSAWLDRTRWRDEPEILASNLQYQALANLLNVREQIARLEAEDSRLVNLLKDSMAGASRLNAPRLGRIVWTAPTEVRTVRWKDVAGALRGSLEDDAWEALLSDNASVREARTFRVTDEREESAS